MLKNPAEVGADRIVNAVAAFKKYGTSLIVVDFGTATTFDAVSKDGEYLGGAISPGIGIASEALFREASKLPRVEIFLAPEKVIGKDTISSIKSGIIFGYARSSGRDCPADANRDGEPIRKSLPPAAWPGFCLMSPKPSKRSNRR